MAYEARNWETIFAQIKAQVNTLITSLTSTSMAAYWQLWAFITAVSQNLMEQRFTILQQELETTASAAAPETTSWIQAQVLAFQYGNQIQINPDFSIGYPDPQLPLIISNCAVVPNGAGGIGIKVTSDAGLLSSAQSNALTSYLQSILGADLGANFSLINALPDTLIITGDLYYNGQYSGSIVDNVTNAVNDYITAIGFNGTIKVSDLIEVIRTAAGVTDFVPNNISASPNAGSPIYLVQTGTIKGREYITSSGKIEIDGGSPLSTSLTYRIDNN
jgi:hypothetical protein